MIPLYHIVHHFSEDEFKFLSFLNHNDDFVSANIITIYTGLSARSLRMHGKSPGLRLSTSAKLFKLTGYKIISRTRKPAGFKLSNDPREWMQAANEIEAHLWHEKINANHYREEITGQLNLAM